MKYSSPRIIRGNAHALKMLVILVIVIGFSLFFFKTLFQDEKKYVVTDGLTQGVSLLTVQQLEDALTVDDCWYHHSTGTGSAFSNVYLCLNKEKILKTKYASAEHNLSSTSRSLGYEEQQYKSSMIAAPYSEYFCSRKPQFKGCSTPDKALAKLNSPS